jgi:alkyldihydroxyacetonephosphate synthase
VIVDTMEVAGLWSAVPRLYESIRAALSAHAQAVACHLSHLYPSGSSLYFTFLIGAADDREAEASYRAAWHAGPRKLHRSRRHDHPPSRRRPPQGTVPGPGLGDTGASVLTRIRQALDPAGIMNPEVQRS